MAKAKKLPSGQWRTLIYSHTEKVDGKDKRIYESFTSEEKKESEYMAAEFALNKKNKRDIKDIAFGEALEEYTDKRSAVLSPASIKKYRKLRKSAMQSLMNIKIADLSQEIIQGEINTECLTLSPKTVRDNHGIISAVLSEYRPEFRLRTILPKKVRPCIYVPSEHEISKLMRHVNNREIEIPIMLAAYGGMRRGK